LEGAVPAAHDDDLLIAEEEAVAGGAVAHPATDELVFAGHAQFARRRAGGDDHGLDLILPLRRP